MRQFIAATVTAMAVTAASAATPIPCDATPGCAQMWDMQPTELPSIYSLTVDGEVTKGVAAMMLEAQYVVLTANGVIANPDMAEADDWMPTCNVESCRDNLEHQCVMCHAWGVYGPCDRHVYHMQYGARAGGWGSGCSGECNKHQVSTWCFSGAY